MIDYRYNLEEDLQNACNRIERSTLPNALLACDELLVEINTYDIKTWQELYAQAELAIQKYSWPKDLSKQLLKILQTRANREKNVLYYHTRKDEVELYYLLENRSHREIWPFLKEKFQNSNNKTLWPYLTKEDDIEKLLANPRDMNELITAIEYVGLPESTLDSLKSVLYTISSYTKHKTSMSNETADYKFRPCSRCWRYVSSRFSGYNAHSVYCHHHNYQKKLGEVPHKNAYERSAIIFKDASDWMKWKENMKQERYAKLLEKEDAKANKFRVKLKKAEENKELLFKIKELKHSLFQLVPKTQKAENIFISNWYTDMLEDPRSATNNFPKQAWPPIEKVLDLLPNIVLANERNVVLNSPLALIKHLMPLHKKANDVEIETMNTLYYVWENNFYLFIPELVAAENWLLQCINVHNKYYFYG